MILTLQGKELMNVKKLSFATEKVEARYSTYF